MMLAESSWRRLDGRHLLPLVQAGVAFKDGIKSEPGPTDEVGRQKTKTINPKIKNQPKKVAA